MKQIERSEADGIVRLALNRPDQLNSLTEVMCSELHDALVQAATDTSVRCVVVTGNGRGFCAGQDLAEIGIDTPEPVDLGVILGQRINPVVQAMRGMDKPVLCAVNGVAAGAGANIALAGDVVVAARSARFIQAFRHVGLIPDGGGTWLLPRLAGEARAMGMSLFGEPVSAEQAESWGMIWRVLDDDAFDAGVQRMAAQLATGPTAALGLAKRAIAASHHNTLEQQLDLERDFQRAAAAGDDYREGVRAFLAKRKPSFKGR